MAGSTRFNDLRRGVPKMSPSLLSKRLSELELANVVERLPCQGEPGVFEYHLTESGKDLRKVIENVGTWGQTWVESRLSLKQLDPSLLMWDMRRNIVTEPMPDSRSGYSFCIPNSLLQNATGG